MITKQSKITANKKPKQSNATGTPLARSPEVCPKAALAQPLSSAEFLGELEQQRTQRSREDREKLTEAIMAVGAARARTGSQHRRTGQPRGPREYQAGHRRASGPLRGGAADRRRGAATAAAVQS